MPPFLSMGIFRGPGFLPLLDTPAAALVSAKIFGMHKLAVLSQVTDTPSGAPSTTLQLADDGFCRGRVSMPVFATEAA